MDTQRRTFVGQRLNVPLTYTNIIDWPVYCGYEQYCNTLNDYLQCCTEMTTFPVTKTQVQTYTSNVRNQFTTTITTTYYQSQAYNYSLRGCAGWTSCYDYSDSASCTGDCASSNLVCTDQGWPSCASLYMNTYINSDTTAAVVAQSWFCDTAAYGLEYGDWGYWPSVTSTYTTTLNQTTTSTPPTWTPSIVPFTQKQMSLPASGVTAPTPTATSGASTYELMTFMSVVSAMTLWMLVIYIT